MNVVLHKTQQLLELYLCIASLTCLNKYNSLKDAFNILPLKRGKHHSWYMYPSAYTRFVYKRNNNDCLIVFVTRTRLLDLIIQSWVK